MDKISIEIENISDKIEDIYSDDDLSNEIKNKRIAELKLTQSKLLAELTNMANEIQVEAEKEYKLEMEKNNEEELKNYREELKQYEREIENYKREIKQFEKESKNLNGNNFNDEKIKLDPKKEMSGRHLEYSLEKNENFNREKIQNNLNVKKALIEHQKARIEQDKAFKAQIKAQIDQQKAIRERDKAFEARNKVMMQSEKVMAELESELMKDNLIKDIEKYDFELSREQIWVNHVKQNQAVFEKYKKFLKERFNINVDDFKNDTNRYHISKNK